MKDIPQVVRVANQAFLETERYPSYVGPKIIGFMERLPGRHFVAVADGHVVGFIVVDVVDIDDQKDVPRMHLPGVHPDWQRKLVDGKSVIGKGGREYEEVSISSVVKFGALR